MLKPIAIAAASISMLALSAPAFAQANQQTSPRDTIGSILGTIFGGRVGSSTSLDAQWASGQTPLSNRQYQFQGRVDTEVRSGNLDQAIGARLKADYTALVQLESRYAADGRFTTQERADLADRYGALTQVLADRRYADGATAANTSATNVAAGRAEFNSRVDAATRARRITRTQSTRLKADYASVVQIESNYLRDGEITAAERNDLDVRLDALDARLGDTAYTAVSSTPRSRLDAVARALPRSGLTRTVQTQLLVELGDLTRLADAYARASVSAEDQAYLDRRLVDVETRARLRR